ncbi:hypothetical protein [Bilophila wadsworthia]|uniref:hypothetical protein n=1 Tax=Bilophila wadsworthia TaxID=35833 RepID=UPI00242EFEA2|nr:hypothetical protein [Bilophila wadsworthia]
MPVPTVHLLITLRGPVWRVRILIPRPAAPALAGIPRRGVPDSRSRGSAVRGGAIRF